MNCRFMIDWLTKIIERMFGCKPFIFQILLKILVPIFTVWRIFTRLEFRKRK